MRLERIETIEDERAEPYRNVRDADLVGRRGLFMAEGELVVRTLLLGRSRFHAESVLLAESRFPALRDALESASDDLPVYVAAQEVMDAIVGFPIHRGVLAAGKRGETPQASDLLKTIGGPTMVVAMEDLANHDNVGGVLRNAAAFGAAAALFTDGCCDPLYRKAIRVSMGAALTTPLGNLPAGRAGVEALRVAGFTTIALTPARDAVEIDALEGVRFARAALLLGAEGPGLRDDTLGAADVRVRIAIAEGVDSLNVATASGVALHRLAAIRRAHQEGR